MPQLDQDALERAIAAQEDQVANVEFKTRSQVELESLEADAANLKLEGEDIRTQMKRLRTNIDRFEGIYATMKANEEDIAIQLAAKLAAIDKLRTSGV